MVERKPTVAGKGTRSPLSSSATLTPKEVFAILRRHVLLIVILTIFGLITGGAGWYAFRIYLPSYCAQTYIEVLPPVESDPMTIGSIQVQKDIQYGYRVSMANLIKQQSSLQELLRNDKVRSTNWFKRMDEDTRKAVRYLKKHLGAYAHRDAEYVEISMTCREAQEAALIVNEMAQLFVNSQAGAKKGEISERLARLEDRRRALERELTAANNALDEVREAWGISDLESPAGRYFQHTVTLMLNDLRIQENQLILSISQLRASIENLKELATGPIAEQIEIAVEQDPIMISLAQQLAFQEAQLSGRLAKFGENHRIVRSSQELIEEIKEKRRQRKTEIAEQTRRANLENARDSLVILQERLTQLESLRDQANQKKKDLDLARVQYDQRMKIRDERIEMLDALKEQIEKVKIMLNDPETTKVQLVGFAPEPLDMTASRQWWLWLPGGTILGFLLSIAFAFLIEMLNDLVRTPRDVARFLHIPLLGVIPDEAEDKDVRDVDLWHVVRDAPYSIIGEAYRRCRTNLELSSSVESLSTLLIASGDAEDGTTSVAVNLATAFVAKEKKVLLIDANFRQPSLGTIFPRTKDNANSNKPRSDSGLSALLTGRSSYKDVIRPSGIQDLHIIDSGSVPSKPAELLTSSKMGKLVKEMSKNYDHIIIDGPPILLVSDSKVLAQLVDSTLLVFNAAATRRGAAMRTIQEMREVSANVIGCVLFAVRSMKGGYFRERYKSYRRYQDLQPVGSA
jgi:succinoglycan biosynthesis transport protein ExoP